MSIYHRICVVGACCAVAALATNSVARAAEKNAAKFASPVVNSQTPGHAVEIEADIDGAKQLYLFVTDGGDGFGCDWADWCEPRLIGPAARRS